MFGGVVVISGHSRELPGFPNTGVFASNKAWDAGVRTMADMRGRVIGLTTIGSTNHYAVARIAEKYGFDINDNHLVPAQGLGNLAAMLMGNQVDVASGAGTAFMGLITQGKAHVIGWAGDELSWQSTGLASSPRVIAEKRAALQAVIDAYERGAAEYSAVLLDKNADGSYKDPAKADELLAAHLALYVGAAERDRAVAGVHRQPARRRQHLRDGRVVPRPAHDREGHGSQDVHRSHPSSRATRTFRRP